MKVSKYKPITIKKDRVLFEQFEIDGYADLEKERYAKNYHIDLRLPGENMTHYLTPETAEKIARGILSILKLHKQYVAQDKVNSKDSL